ncbi:hypothetical protein CPB86DRAFT_797618 [Serendipita vermifera]|nr:hypothetical protein CPB86DRAFT_797618 [Serendipita vermifera]
MQAISSVSEARDCSDGCPCRCHSRRAAADIACSNTTTFITALRPPALTTVDHLIYKDNNRKALYYREGVGGFPLRSNYIQLHTVIDGVALWKLFTRCHKSIEQGRRWENLCWRNWSRYTMHSPRTESLRHDQRSNEQNSGSVAASSFMSGSVLDSSNPTPRAWSVREGSPLSPDDEHTHHPDTHPLSRRQEGYRLDSTSSVNTDTSNSNFTFSNSCNSTSGTSGYGDNSDRPRRTSPNSFSSTGLGSFANSVHPSSMAQQTTSTSTIVSSIICPPPPIGIVGNATDASLSYGIPDESAHLGERTVAVTSPHDPFSRGEWYTVGANCHLWVSFPSSMTGYSSILFISGLLDVIGAYGWRPKRVMGRMGLTIAGDAPIWFTAFFPFLALPLARPTHHISTFTIALLSPLTPQTSFRPSREIVKEIELW